MMRAVLSRVAISSSLAVSLVTAASACQGEHAALPAPSGDSRRSSASVTYGRADVLDASIVTEAGPSLEAGLADLDSITPPR
jgi:hypothetical protein